MKKLILQATAIALFAMASVRPGAAADLPDEADVAPPDDGATVAAPLAARRYDLVPYGISPVVAEQAVVAHVWGGYARSAGGAVGEAIVEGKLTRFLTIRLGASSWDLSGRSTAQMGARLAILRQSTSPIDLGLGVFYQPQAISGDGLVMAHLAAGKTFGQLSTQASLGYGQDPEGDDGLGSASLGAGFSFVNGLHAGLQSRARMQLWSHDKKFETVEQPVLDFSAGPVVGYPLGPVDIIAHVGISGLMLRAPPEAPGSRHPLQMGPMAMFGVGAAL